MVKEGEGGCGNGGRRCEPTYVPQLFSFSGNRSAEADQLPRSFARFAKKFHVLTWKDLLLVFVCVCVCVCVAVCILHVCITLGL